jgi:chromosome segregation ATPase
MSRKIRDTAEERHRMIAQTAYFLAQERGFAGGDPVTDWLEAERRVDRQLCTRAIAHTVEQFQSSVATAARQLNVLKRRASKVSASARAEFNAELEKLNAVKDSLRSELEELKRRSDELGERALHQAESTWNDLSETLQRLTARVRH